MCRSVENLTRKYEERGEARGEQKRAIATALKMLSDGSLTIEKIADFSGLTVDDVKTLAEHAAD